jgi:hypothetical protein
MLRIVVLDPSGLNLTEPSHLEEYKLENLNYESFLFHRSGIHYREYGPLISTYMTPFCNHDKATTGFRYSRSRFQYGELIQIHWIELTDSTAQC